MDLLNIDPPCLPSLVRQRDPQCDGPRRG